MSSPNFHIVEGEYDDIDYESFKKDYTDLSVPKKDILEKYNLTHSRYLKYSKQVFKDTGFKRNKTHHHLRVTPMRNIRYVDKKYRLDKQVDGEKYYLGTYDTLEEAREVRDMLIRSGWNVDLINKVREGFV